MGKPVFVVSNQSETKQAVRPQKMVIGLKYLYFRKKRHCTVYVAKTKALISCVFVFAYMRKAGFHMTRLNYAVVMLLTDFQDNIS